MVKFLDEVDAYFKDRQYDSLRELEKICKRAEDQLKIASRQLDDESLQSLGKVETELNNALWRIQLKIDADKTLKNDAKVLQWLDALDEEENNVALARRNYNRAAAEYNNLCSSFPTKWFAEFFGRRSQAFDLKFEDNVAIQASPKLLG
ncbi:LemA family protein [Neisseria weaveri]|uniref:LemA family protein n=1 Tax=Neisseria weaveri TaxID=28091 RepID=UPI00022300FD|nr:LemA family protein [Neisseria weaveri]EGV35563.1 hypothetical protein l13_15800 [Neisseria weaveri ATCC 51223]